MKFHYKNKKVIRYGLFFVSVFVLQIVLFWFTMDFMYLIFGASALVGIIGFYSLYRKEVGSVIEVNDDLIRYQNREVKIEINWSEITLVDWNLKEEFMQIKSKEREIVIGKRIDGLPDLIQFIKSKVGAKFNTTEIPLDLKISTGKKS